MKKILLGAMMTLAAIPAVCFGQDGTDIGQAIPIYFGQTINDTIDKTTRPWQVYSITLAKGQQFSATGTASSPYWYLSLAGPSIRTVIGNNTWLAINGNWGAGLTWTYTAATAGVYYIAVNANAVGINYKLQVAAVGPVITQANPATSGCVTGQVDYVTYSTQLVAAGIPDEASIGGAKLCSNGCIASPPSYPLLVTKMERALESGTPVSACYDASGAIFQLKIMHP